MKAADEKWVIAKDINLGKMFIQSVRWYDSFSLVKKSQLIRQLLLVKEIGILKEIGIQLCTAWPNIPSLIQVEGSIQAFCFYFRYRRLYVTVLIDTIVLCGASASDSSEDQPGGTLIYYCTVNKANKLHMEMYSKKKWRFFIVRVLTDNSDQIKWFNNFWEF